VLNATPPLPPAPHLDPEDGEDDEEQQHHDGHVGHGGQRHRHRPGAGQNPGSGFIKATECRAPQQNAPSKARHPSTRVALNPSGEPIQSVRQGLT
jgi:hypothetical protein